MVTVNEFLKRTREILDQTEDPLGLLHIRPMALCEDGFTACINANEKSYCTPRRWDANSYSDVEVYGPSVLDEELAPWSERGMYDKEFLSFVPVYLLDKVLMEKHGGIVGYINWNGDTVKF